MLNNEVIASHYHYRVYLVYIRQNSWLQVDAWAPEYELLFALINWGLRCLSECHVLFRLWPRTSAFFLFLFFLSAFYMIDTSLFYVEMPISLFVLLVDWIFLFFYQEVNLYKYMNKTHTLHWKMYQEKKRNKMYIDTKHSNFLFFLDVIFSPFHQRRKHSTGISD